MKYAATLAAAVGAPVTTKAPMPPGWVAWVSLLQDTLLVIGGEAATLGSSYHSSDRQSSEPFPNYSPCDTIISMESGFKMYFGQVFPPGSIVLVTLNNPREKFLGALLSLDGSGICLCGIDLQSLDDFAVLMKTGEATAPSAVFFPMHRIERMELDARNGEIPSLAEQFSAKSGRPASSFFREPGS